MDRMKMNMNAVILCEDVSFAYNGIPALHGQSFDVQTGEVFALLGPNGAGKTTSIRILNGLLKPQSGRCRVLGLDPSAQGALIRRRTGVLTETPALYERLSAWQNLHFFGALAGLSVEEIDARGAYYLDLFELGGRAGDRVETYSKGMKQRLALARALLHGPELLFLDEPTSGMDPAAARQVEELIYQVSKRENRSVVLCTHRLYEAEKVCDRVAVMKKGSVLASGSLDDLRVRFAPQVRVAIRFQLMPALNTLEAVRNLRGVASLNTRNGNDWELRLESTGVIPVIVRMLVEAGASVEAVIPSRASLEDIYLQLQTNEHEALQ